jgi:hypothetical protein
MSNETPDILAHFGNAGTPAGGRARRLYGSYD